MNQFNSKAKTSKQFYSTKLIRNEAFSKIYKKSDNCKKKSSLSARLML